MKEGWGRSLIPPRMLKWSVITLRSSQWISRHYSHLWIYWLLPLRQYKCNCPRNVHHKCNYTRNLQLQVEFSSQVQTSNYASHLPYLARSRSVLSTAVLLSDSKFRDVTQRGLKSKLPFNDRFQSFFLSHKYASISLSAILPCDIVLYSFPHM